MPIMITLLTTLVLQSTTPVALDPATMLDALTAGLQQRYIDAEVAERMVDAIRKEQAEGAYAGQPRVELAQRLTRTLQNISHDKHLRVFDTPPSPAVLAAKPTIGRVEILAGNVGYIEVPSLAQPPAVAAPQIVEAMTRVAGTAALVIDVRGNGGGSPATVALMAAYLLKPEAVLLATIDNRSQQSRVESRTPESVDGTRYGTTKPVFVLIDSRSASAAESLAYFLQAFKRATIVGERSAGAANPGSIVRLPGEFAVFIPTGRVTNPVTGGNWEGSGVIPTIVTAPAAALDAALAAAKPVGARND